MECHITRSGIHLQRITTAQRIQEYDVAISITLINRSNRGISGQHYGAVEADIAAFGIYVRGDLYGHRGLQDNILPASGVNMSVDN